MADNYFTPAKETDAPEGYTLCTQCNGAKLVGKDGKACCCAVYGQYAGYMRKTLTTIKIQSCKECKDCEISRENTSDPFETCSRFYCTLTRQAIAHYVDWYEKPPKVPKWCPKR